MSRGRFRSRRSSPSERRSSSSAECSTCRVDRCWRSRGSCRWPATRRPGPWSLPSPWRSASRSLCNYLNAMMVALFNAPAFIATLAMQEMARGARSPLYEGPEYLPDRRLYEDRTGLGRLHTDSPVLPRGALPGDLVHPQQYPIRSGPLCDWREPGSGKGFGDQCQQDQNHRIHGQRPLRRHRRRPFHVPGQRRAFPMARSTMNSRGSPRRSSAARASRVELGPREGRSSVPSSWDSSTTS